jgi:hypothetical protein
VPNDYKTTYQPPAQPVAPTELNPNKIHVREYAAGVWIPLWQNFFGGVGLFVFVTILHWLISNDPWASIETGAILGGLLFGAVTTFRAWSDEALKMLAAWGSKQDKATRAALQAQVKQYERELAALRSQGVIQSKYLAMQAAERLMGDYFERHLDIHRAAAMQRGYSRPLWDAAMKILKAAGVVNGKTDVLIATYPEAWARILRSQQAGMGQYTITETGDMVRVG